MPEADMESQNQKLIVVSRCRYQVCLGAQHNEVLAKKTVDEYIERGIFSDRVKPSEWLNGLAVGPNADDIDFIIAADGKLELREIYAVNVWHHEGCAHFDLNGG